MFPGIYFQFLKHFIADLERFHWFLILQSSWKTSFFFTMFRSAQENAEGGAGEDQVIVSGYIYIFPVFETFHC